MDYATKFKHVCWLYTKNIILKYLRSNADGYYDGGEKADRHMQLCMFYVATIRGIEEDEVHRSFKTHDHFTDIHTETSELTSYLDEQIGFPLKGNPDYKILSPLFFDKFHEIAINTPYKP